MLAAPVTEKNVSRAMLRHYPQAALAKGKSAAAFVEFWVDPGGKVYDCKTLTHIGDEALASEACRILLKINVKPAKDADGLAAYGRVQTLVRFFLPGTESGREIASLAPSPDLRLSVVSLPSEFATELETTLVGLVDTEGRIVQCETSEDAPANYGRVACDTLSASRLAKGVDKDGSPVSYVTSLSVRFTEAEPDTSR